MSDDIALLLPGPRIDMTTTLKVQIFAGTKSRGYKFSC